MLKLNKTQKEIEVLARRVPKITNEQLEWAKKNFNYFKIVLQGTMQTRCPECKHNVPIYPNKKGARWNKEDYMIVCPHCGAKIQVRIIPNDRYSKPYFNNHQEDFFQVMNIVGGWQVTRLIYMERYCYVRRESTDWSFYEVCQAWNNPKHATTFFRAFPKKGFGSQYRFNPYRLFDWYCKRDENGNYLHDEKGYYICGHTPSELIPRRTGGANYFETHHLAPGAKILPEYKQKGGITRQFINEFSRQHNAMWLFECFSEKNYKPMYETLLKRKSYSVFNRITDQYHRRNADAYITAWKICQRNHYDCEKYKNEWFDLIDMLVQLGLDYHSPHYVCPKDVNYLHQRLLAQVKKKQDLLYLQEEMKKNGEYVKRIEKYLDMDIHNDTLHIIVLPSIKAFKDEGDHLGHCVFRMGYYMHTDSLILSARDDSGKRWETIEVNLRDFSIVQSYGYGDKHTERHKEIVNLVKENMWQIRERRLAS